jgi:hypothetical protein
MKEEGAGKVDESPVPNLREMLRVAMEDLETARANSTRIEEETQNVAEKALALRDQVADAEQAADAAIAQIEYILAKELAAGESVAAARAAFAAAEENMKRAEKALEATGLKLKIENNGSASVSEDKSIDLDDHKCEAGVVAAEESSMVAANIELEKAVDERMEVTSNPIDAEETEQTMDTLEDMDGRKTLAEEEGELEIAKAELKASELAITRLEAELAQIQTEKSELQKKAMQLSEAAQLVKDAAAAADEDVASAMLRAEEAVAMEVKAAERVSDTEIALQKAETLAESTSQADAAVLQVDISEDLPQQVSRTANGPLLETDDYIILQKVKQGGEGGLGVVSPEALEKVGETTQEDGHVLQFQD